MLGYTEMLTDDEVDHMTDYLTVKYSAVAFLAFVQVPMSVYYFLKWKKNPKQNLTLMRRLRFLPFATLTPLFYCNWQINKLLNSYSDKYLSKLTDAELDNFDTLYLQNL